MHEPTISNKSSICYDSSEISSDDNSDDEELNTRIGNTNWCICGNCSKMDTSTESLCCREERLRHRSREQRVPSSSPAWTSVLR